MSITAIYCWLAIGIVLLGVGLILGRGLRGGEREHREQGAAGHLSLSSRSAWSSSPRSDAISSSSR